MFQRATTWIPSFVLAAGGLFYGASAAAHISLEQAGTHESRYGDGELKDAPCGKEGGARGTHVYTYDAGETIEVRLKEYIPHPGYFRFAFDDDGDDDFVDPVSIDPVDPNRPCPFNDADQCGESDFYNNDTVLSGMDDLEPHTEAAFGEEYTFQVTLPDVECDNCTLQVIQVMEDTVHGAYNTVPGDPADTPYIADVYHQCIDLVLEKDEAPTGGYDAGTGPSTGSDTNADDGGCSLAAQPGRTLDGRGWMLFAFGVAVALAGRRVRRSLLHQRRPRGGRATREPLSGAIFEPKAGRRPRTARFR